MTSGLTLVLPAFNEAERIDPALDELFGYLRRREGRGRDGALGAVSTPESIDVLVVDDGSSDDTAARVEARPESSGTVPGVALRVLRVPHGGKGAAVRAGMLAAAGDLVIFADADMATPPDQIPLLVGALARPRRRARVADPGGRLRHAGDATRLPSPPRQGFPPAGVRVGGGPGPGHPVRVQGLHAGQPPRTCSSGSASRASCSMSRSSTSPAAVATGSRSSRSAGSTSAGRACVPGPGWRCGSPGTCSASRSCTEGAAAAPPKGRDGPPGCLGIRARGAPGRRDPVVRCGPRCDAGVRGRHARVRLPRVSPGRCPAPRRPTAL